MKISKIKLTDFNNGKITGELDFSHIDGNVSFITGPTGYGKSILLKILTEISTGRTRYINYLGESFDKLFQNITVEFTDGTSHTFKYTDDTDDRYRFSKTPSNKITTFSPPIYRVTENKEYSYEIFNVSKITDYICRLNNWINKTDVLNEYRIVINDNRLELLKINENIIVDPEDSLSSGQYELYSLLVNLIYAKENDYDVILIDNLGNCQHVATQIMLPDFLNEFSDRKQIIAVTNHPAAFNFRWNLSIDLFRINRKK